ncbi:MAG: carboxypeptidase-like regulatory domain-containing protein, partial [Tannerellaceae bacterium]
MKTDLFFNPTKPTRCILCGTLAGLALFSEGEPMFAAGIKDNVSSQLVMSSSFAESTQNERNIKGTIVDQYGEPLIGANIIVKGSTVGTMSNMDGEFEIAVPTNGKIEVSYIGYLTQLLTPKSNTIKIVLQEDAKALEEVVVTGFGLAQKKESLTSAIAVIGSEDLARSSASTSSGALVGKIAGVNTRQPDGRPGASTQIQIRNMGTPLYVIDGVQKDEGQFNNIDFNDIESISILKDASASI